MNPFKKTYKIIEYKNPKGEKFFRVKFGNIFGREFLALNSDCTWRSEVYSDWNGGKCSNIEQAKRLIEKHREKKENERLEKLSIQNTYNV